MKVHLKFQLLTSAEPLVSSMTSEFCALYSFYCSCMQYTECAIRKHPMHLWKQVACRQVMTRMVAYELAHIRTQPV